MHLVNINDGEYELLKLANISKDWRILPTWKLRYLYQRAIALPKRDMKSVQEIAGNARSLNENNK